jgi:DNA-binding transcriptional MocR family regulator
MIIKSICITSVATSPFLLYTKEIESPTSAPPNPADTRSIEERIGAACTERTASGIANAIGSLVRSGELEPGDRLPTVRALAKELDVSSNTISESWRTLGQHGVIATARRNGTVVRAARAEMSGRFWKVPAVPGSGIIDLSTGTPDIDLLPPLGSMIKALPNDIEITSYIDRPVLEELEAVLHTRWPFDAEAMTVVDGALDALDRLIRALVTFGDVVVVEDPTFPPILDMLEQAGASIIGVGLDKDGARPDHLADALSSLPVLAILQPRAQNPTGTAMTTQRINELGRLFQAHSPDTWIVEDHHAGDLMSGPLLSLGIHRPDRVVHIHSFSKSHGPDLRIAAVGGARDPIAAIVDRRRLGPSWTSRLVQHMLLTLLQDPATDQLVEHAAASYAARRKHIVMGLRAHGIEMRDAEGLNLWIPVANEQRAVVALALNGVGVAPGAPFNVDTGAPTNHIRISVGNARGDLDELVAAIVVAASS